MKIGAHVSIAKSIAEAPLRAKKLGCEVFQMFTRSPHGGSKSDLTAELVARFKANVKKSKISEFYIHSPYFINLGSPNSRIYYSSISAIKDDLERGSLLGAKYLMFHPGSGKDLGRDKSLELVVKGIDKILEGYKGNCELIIENSAGAGQILGDTFEEIAYILKNIKSKKVGVCFDTCHAFASGYDLRTKKKVKKVISEFNKVIGLDKLKLFHFNDSKIEFNTKRDRHEIIGKGFIGTECFQTLLHYAKLNKINAIVETPDLKNSSPDSLKLLFELRKRKKIN